MKKIYTTLLFSVSIVFLTHAQPVVNGPNLPPVGTIVTTHEVNAAALSPGSSGANQTWDFSAFPPTGNTSSSQYVNPATTPFAATFPTATNSTVAGTTAGNQGFSYIYATSTYLDLIGVAIQGTGSPDIVYTYSDPERIGNFPSTFNSTYTDNFTGFATYVNGGYTINQYRMGMITYTYDAYGTLTTPSGTFPNAVRSKLTQVITDSIVIVGFPTGSVTVDHNTVYGWGLAAGYSSLYYINYDTMSTITGTTYSKTAAYTTLITGINDFSQTYKALDVYPNPSTSSSLVTLQAEDLKPGLTKFTMIDVQGKLVKSFEFKLLPSNHQSVSFDPGEITAGIYSIRLEQPDAIYVTRFLRQ